MTPWTVARQAPLSMGLSRQEYWSGLPFPFPGDLPNPGIEPGSPAWQADALSSEPPGNSHQGSSSNTFFMNQHVCGGRQEQKEPRELQSTSYKENLPACEDVPDSLGPYGSLL